MNAPKPPGKSRGFWNRYKWPLLFSVVFVALGCLDYIALVEDKTIAKSFFGAPTMQAFAWLATVFGLGYAIVQIVESSSKLEAVAAATRATKASNHQKLLVDAEKLLKLAYRSIQAQNIPVANGLLSIIVERLQFIHWEAISMGLTYDSGLTEEIRKIETAQQKIVAAGSLSSPREIDERLQDAKAALINGSKTLNSIAGAAAIIAARPG
jgi:hypothetical protein